MPVATAAAAVFCLALIAPYFVSYDRSFVHPHRMKDHLPMLVPDGVAFTLRDLAMPFRDHSPGDFRPRFLTYLIILLDLKLRLASYAWGVLHPALSLAWLPQLILAPYLLYRLVINLTGDRHSAALGVLVYVTSIGFLSGVAMLFMPGKPLSNVAFLAVLTLLSSVVARADRGALFHELRPSAVVAILLITLVSLFLDEVTLFTPVLIVVVFLDRFLADPRRAAGLKRMARSALLLATPLVAFLLLVVVVTPAISSRMFGYDFDYFSLLFGSGAGPAQRSFREQLFGRFGGRTLLSNLLSLPGVALVPGLVSPLVGDPGDGGGVLNRQETNAAQLVLLAGAVVVLTVAARRMPPERRRCFGRVLVAAGLFVAFQSVLAGRHVPYVIGYYYGSAFSVFLAVIAGMAASALGGAERRRLVALGVVLLVAVVQVTNFDRIHRSNLHAHHERLTRDWFQQAIPIAEGQRVSARELSAIWEAWKAGGLEPYLAARAVSPGAVFLVVELRWLDKLRAAESRPPA